MLDTDWEEGVLLVEVALVTGKLDVTEDTDDDVGCVD